MHKYKDKYKNHLKQNIAKVQKIKWKFLKWMECLPEEVQELQITNNVPSGRKEQKTNIFSETFLLDSVTLEPWRQLYLRLHTKKI